MMKGERQMKLLEGVQIAAFSRHLAGGSARHAGDTGVPNRAKRRAVAGARPRLNFVNAATSEQSERFPFAHPSADRTREDLGD